MRKYMEDEKGKFSQPTTQDRRRARRDRRRTRQDERRARQDERRARQDERRARQDKCLRARQDQQTSAGPDKINKRLRGPTR
jgi:hypothetical protein